MTVPDRLVNLGKCYSAPSVGGDNLTRDEVKVTAGLRPGTDEDSVVSGLANVEIPIALRAVRVGTVARPFTDDSYESQVYKLTRDWKSIWGW